MASISSAVLAIFMVAIIASSLAIFSDSSAGTTIFCLVNLAIWPLNIFKPCSKPLMPRLIPSKRCCFSTTSRLNSSIDCIKSLICDMSASCISSMVVALLALSRSSFILAKFVFTSSGIVVPFFSKLAIIESNRLIWLAICFVPRFICANCLACCSGLGPC